MKPKLEGDILILTDSGAKIPHLYNWLQQSQYQARFTKPGRTAMVAITEKQPAIMIVDLTLAEVAGFQMLSFMKQHYPQIPIIALTNDDNIGTARKSIQAGANDFLLKSFDEALLHEALSRMVALARQNRFDKICNEITTAVGSTLTLERMMEQVLMLAKTGVYAEDGSLFILDDEAWVIRHLILVDQGQQVQTQSSRIDQIMEKGLVGWVYRYRQSAIIENSNHDERWLNFPDRPARPRSIMAVPFVSRGIVQGVLLLIHPEINQFDHQDLRFLESMALPAAMAIENGRLFEREQQKSQEMTALYQTGLSIASALDYQAATRTIVQQIATTIGADSCAISRWDKLEDRLVTLMSLVAECDQWREGREERNIGDFQAVGDYPLLQEPLFQQKIAIRYSNDPLLSSEERTWMDRRNVKAVMIYPLIVRGDTTGIITLAYQGADKAFTSRDERLMQGVIAQVSVALENVSLFEQVKAQTDWLRTQAQALEGERRKLAAILQSTTDVVLAIDLNGLILLANPALETAFTLNAQAVIGQPYQQILEATALQNVFEQVQQENHTFSFEVEAQSGRTFYANVTPVPNVGYVAMLRDISHLKELDNMRTELLSTASHDLKNPLTAIRGFTHLLLETEGLDARQRGMLEYIDKMSVRMSSLTTDLLDLAQLEAGFNLKREWCDLNACAQAIMQDLESQWHTKHITVTLALHEGLPHIYADTKRIDQVLTNLMSNAIKYTPDGGQIWIQTRLAEENAEGNTPDTILFSIQDTGYGILPEDIPHLFDRFYRGQSPESMAIEGTGIGLAIVKTIIDQHGGQIWVESEEGKGSKFTFAISIIALL